jgi:hypothetical protein
MGPAGSSDRTSGRLIAARPQAGTVPPTIVVIEQYALLSWQYSHVLDYLGLRLHNVRSVSELNATLRTHAPMALIWELAAGLDGSQVLHAISEFDRTLPMLIVLDDDTGTPAIIDSTIRFLRITDVTKRSGEPALRDLVEFLFRAGRGRGEFRVLSV